MQPATREHPAGLPTGVMQLWPTPLGVHHHPNPSELNPLLVRVFNALRAADAHNKPEAPFHASSDDLLGRIRLQEWDGFVQFLVGHLRDTVAQANQHAWPQALPGLRIAIKGMWFQISNRGAHHDVHTHGNCSWSGVYCVQVDAHEQRTQHPVYGASNGVTRFYGPHFNHLAGAHADFGNAYLQGPHLDVAPLPGQLLLFPSWLAHQAMPYEGSLSRIIVSFNASVHAEADTDQLHHYDRT